MTSFSNCNYLKQYYGPTTKLFTSVRALSEIPVTGFLAASRHVHSASQLQCNQNSRYPYSNSNSNQDSNNNANQLKTNNPVDLKTGTDIDWIKLKAEEARKYKYWEISSGTHENVDERVSAQVEDATTNQINSPYHKIETVTACDKTLARESIAQSGVDKISEDKHLEGSDKSFGVEAASKIGSPYTSIGTVIADDKTIFAERVVIDDSGYHVDPSVLSNSDSNLNEMMFSASTSVKPAMVDDKITATERMNISDVGYHVDPLILQDLKENEAYASTLKMEASKPAVSVNENHFHDEQAFTQNRRNDDGTEYKFGEAYASDSLEMADQNVSAYISEETTIADDKTLAIERLRMVAHGSKEQKLDQVLDRKSADIGPSASSGGTVQAASRDNQFKLLRRDQAPGHTDYPEVGETLTHADHSGKQAPSHTDNSKVGQTLTHTDQSGKLNMVDVSSKPDTARTAVATGMIFLGKEAFILVKENKIKKGDVLTVAKLAGIMGAKRTSDLIPLCHSIPLSKVAVDVELLQGTYAVRVTALAKTYGKTGVEMEAITAVALASVTVYDMCKAVTKDIVISDIKLLHKSGGKSGEYNAEE